LVAHGLVSCGFTVFALIRSLEGSESVLDCFYGKKRAAVAKKDNKAGPPCGRTAAALRGRQPLFEPRLLPRAGTQRRCVFAKWQGEGRTRLGYDGRAVGEGCFLCVINQLRAALRRIGSSGAAEVISTRRAKRCNNFGFGSRLRATITPDPLLVRAKDAGHRPGTRPEFGHREKT